MTSQAFALDSRTSAETAEGFAGDKAFFVTAGNSAAVSEPSELRFEPVPLANTQGVCPDWVDAISDRLRTTGSSPFEALVSDTSEWVNSIDVFPEVQTAALDAQVATLVRFLKVSRAAVPSHAFLPNVVTYFGYAVRKGLAMPGSSAQVNVDPVSAYRAIRQSAQESRDDALSRLRARLDTVGADYARSSPKDVIVYLTDTLGIGQLVTARALGVTPTAVRKWRRGETATPEHRDRLARFAALCQLLTEVGLHDPAGWLDMPISSASIATPLDLLLAGRADLVVLFGARLADPHETLDAFDPDWRKTYRLDADYEIVSLQDGSRSAVPRRKERD